MVRFGSCDKRPGGVEATDSMVDGLVGGSSMGCEVLVEAAGVEPASEIAVSRESPCCVRFDWVRSTTLKNGQDAPEASPMIS